MPSIVYQYVKGRKYAYSSESYWDKEKKAPRAHLTYLGAVDEETGEIIPSKKRRKEQQKLEAEKVARCPGTDSQEKLSAMIAENEQLKNGSGYDHNFVLREGKGLRLAARMEADETGIAMDVLTDLPGMQLYTASCTDTDGGKGGCHYGQYSAACFETQYFPDSIHHDNFPSCVLKAGENFVSVTEYRFSRV